VSGRTFAGTRSQDFPHFEALFRTPVLQLPSVVQIGFAFLPSLPGWQRQNLYLPQYASKQAPRQMARPFDYHCDAVPSVFCRHTLFHPQLGFLQRNSESIL
jgi:hypothetical protein